MPVVFTLGGASARGFGEFNQSQAGLYVEDLFSTYIYTGTGSTTSIYNNINLLNYSNNEGMVWIKSRSLSNNHAIYDNVRGATYQLSSNLNAAQTQNNDGLTSFLSNGFTIGTSSLVNSSGELYTSWCFQKANKFFDIVQYTGDGTNRTIPHALGSIPGMILVKRTDQAADWQVYHRSILNTQYMVLNSAAGVATGADRWNSTTATDSVFSIGTSTTVNENGGTYIAYLFANNTDTDGMIQCGSYTGNGSSNGPAVNLGWEPQFVLIKKVPSSATWYIFDNIRGASISSNASVFSPTIPAQSAAIESNTSFIQFTTNGFSILNSSTVINETGVNYIYMAVRRGPMAKPIDATKVFSASVYTGTNLDNRLINTGILTDMAWIRSRTSTSVDGFVTANRLAGNGYLLTGETFAESSDADSIMTPTNGYGNGFSSMNGIGVGNDVSAQVNTNTTTDGNVIEAFKRAPGFFDIVLYEGNGSIRTISHNLNAVPELMIVRNRENGENWFVWQKDIFALNSANVLSLNSISGAFSSSTVFNSTAPTSSVFTIGTSTAVNRNGDNCVAYLFASCQNVSKIGVYTGTGATQTINCGFSGGVRFVMIKRTDSNSDWLLYDTARGMFPSNDRILYPNTPSQEVNANSVYTASGGFQIVSTGSEVNSNGGKYIYLAIA